MNQPNKRLITAEDLYDIQVLTACQISPDGKEIIYALQTVDRDNEKIYTNFWTIPTRGGDPKQLTVGKHADTHPKWSPDGKWIAFLSNRQNNHNYSSCRLMAAKEDH